MGGRPKSYRRQFGSLYDIADKTGLKPPHVSRILRGKGVGLANALLVSAALGISVEKFAAKYYPELTPRLKVKIVPPAAEPVSDQVSQAS